MKLSQPARMRCGKEANDNLRRNCRCVATRTNALWQRRNARTDGSGGARRNPHECAVAKSMLQAPQNGDTKSQPARMRCGKVQDGQYFRIVGSGRNPRECAVAKGVCLCRLLEGCSRNPRECAVAKGSELRRLIGRTCRNPHECAVAKIVPPCAAEKGRSVATRANALRQSQYRHGSLTASPSRNPRECAEAKKRVIPAFKCEAGRNPRECAVAKGSELRRLIGRTCRNPRECAEAKLR